MKKLLIGLTILTSVSSFALTQNGKFEPVRVSKFTQSLDASFFDNCISSTEEVSGPGYGYRCVVFEGPKDAVIFKDSGLIASIRYISMYSKTKCPMENIKPIYLNATTTKVELHFDGLGCMKVLKNAYEEQGRFPFMNKSLYIKYN